MKQKLEKIKQFIIKHDELFFIFIFAIINIANSLYLNTEPTDEMWNFQNIYKIYNGYRIYIDANVITTPLFHFIGLIVFKIFGANFFVFRMYGSIINIIISFGIYKIFKSLKISKLSALFLTLLTYIASINVYRNTTNYNNLGLMFAIYGLYFVINRNKYSLNKFIIIQSIISFMILITKQNIGVMYLLSLILYYLIYERKNTIKNIIKTALSISIFSFIFIFILYRLEILEGFISYAVLGIKEFSLKNILIDINILKLLAISLINFILIVIMNRKNIFKENIKNINVISIFAYPFLIYVYPIVNIAHIDLALFFIYISLIYIVYLILSEIVKREMLFKIIVIFIIFFGSTSIVRIILYFQKIDYSYKYNDAYFGTIFEDGINKKIEKVTKFIKDSNRRVIVLSGDAPLYMIPLKESNGNLDEPLLGNFGKDGENGVIREISMMKNTIILLNEEKQIWQESDKIIEYVKDNLSYSGKIEDLIIYQTKN